jgi:hypothetical protein
MSSRRFQASQRSNWLVPAVLVILVIGLVATLTLVGLSLLGIK